MSEEKPVLLVGGCGGVYFLAAPGELRVEVHKRDRSAERPTWVRAVLFGPDRAVLADEWLPAGSAEAPLQTLELRTAVANEGVYGLMISAANDRYGNDMRWGFRTNCPRYLVETSRGHRDARHQEPIVLGSPDRPGEVCFWPQPDALSIELRSLPVQAGAVTCVDAAGTVLATLAPDANGNATHAFPAGPRAGAPWRLRFPSYYADIAIDGVTRWDERDDYPNLSLWTPDASSWFALHESRWLLTPYSRQIYGQPGTAREIDFRVHNNGLEKATVDLSLECPPGTAPGTAELSATRLTLEPRQAQTVQVRLRQPAGEWNCRLRARRGSFTTYSTLTLRPGPAPAASAMTPPLVLTPYRHENEQFGYLPDYPTASQVYFDPANRPYVLTADSLLSWRNDAWRPAEVSLPAGVAPGAMRGSKVAFDAAGGAYALTSLQGAPALLHVPAGGTAATATPLEGRGHFDLENFSGHNLPDGPPPFVRVTRTATDPKLIWRSVNDLELFLPENRDGRLVIGEPVMISRLSIGISDHSGIPSSIVSRGARVHVIWAEATDPEAKAPGVPTYVATYDRTTRTLSEPALIGYGPPANDVHNTPCITMDSKGYLHALVGTHGRTFKYARSLQPNDSAGGWTTTEDVGPNLSQTYVGLVCDRDDTLHLVFRLWQQRPERFPSGSAACLAHMTKPAGQPWSAPQPVILAPFTDYSVFYHRLTIDRRGRLFLSYDYWSTYWFYRTDHLGGRRALLVSDDAGKTWRLAAGADLTGAIDAAP